MTLYGQIIALRDLAKQHHYSCDDPWYSCPMSIDGCCDDSKPKTCQCGADEHNKKVEELTQAIIDQLNKG